MTHYRRPVAPAGELYLPTGVSPEDAFLAIGRLRQEAQDEIERLLSFLDATDGDPDIEPALGFPEPNPWDPRPGDPGGDDDREGDVLDQEGDPADRDAGGVIGVALDQDRPRDQCAADISAKQLLIGKRKQVRVRKSVRQATAGRARL